MSHLDSSLELKVSRITQAVGQFYHPLDAQLKESSSLTEQIKVALSIEVWRQKNEHRIAFFLDFAKGTEAEKTKLQELLLQIHITQNACEKNWKNHQLSNQVPDRELIKWIDDYARMSQAIEDWSSKVDCLDKCYRLIKRYREYSYHLSAEQSESLKNIVDSLMQSDLQITQTIQEKFNPLIKKRYVSSNDFFAEFENHFPSQNKSLILERALYGNLPLGSVLHNHVPSDSVHESVPYEVLKSILSNENFDPSQAFIDIGSGTGTLVNAMHIASKVQVWGVEIIPAFVQIANQAANRLNIPCRFLEEDANNIDLSPYSNIILFSTVNGEALIKLKDRIENSKSVSMIWVIGYIGEKFLDLNWKQISPAAKNELDLQIFRRNW